MTGVPGGVLRDVLTGEIPLVLRQDIYASAAMPASSASTFDEMIVRAGGTLYQIFHA